MNLFKHEVHKGHEGSAIKGFPLCVLRVLSV